MDNQIEVSMGITYDTITTQSNDYGNNTWSISLYSQSPYNNSLVNEYSNRGGYAPQNWQAEPQLPMLNTIWPRMVSNPQPVETPRQQHAPPPPQKEIRRMLNTEKKRAICLYYEQNPLANQREVGDHFGLHKRVAKLPAAESCPPPRRIRISSLTPAGSSTISKILRQKERYLKRGQEQEPSSTKGGEAVMFGHSRKIKDEEIMDQAKLLARASSHQDSLVPSLTRSWLQKFKQKHEITSGRLIKHTSETNAPDSVQISTSTTRTKKEESGSISPISPSGQKSLLFQSPSGQILSSSQLQLGIVPPPPPHNFSNSSAGEKATTPGSDCATSEIARKSALKRQRHTKSHRGRHNRKRRRIQCQETQPACEHCAKAGLEYEYPSSAMSPTGTLTFPPDPNADAFAVDQTLQSQMEDIRASSITPFSDLQLREKCSNTSPSLNLDLVNQVVSSEPMTPRHQIPSTAVSIYSSPVSPSSEDACRAAATLLSYIQSSMKTNAQFEDSDLITLAQLTDKLQKCQSLEPAVRGLSRIPEGNSEVPATTEVIRETI
ncbi:unnamed protein product [Clonostachys chloroleuca]|uniref:HTH CENPB-type domain-containing protein n=1 Tax=Clonostachys chloroleuca TaxID=1926264 RepID=A0AA35M602_9HYPO|nr:unnamed protein product [Clonostachys chloroleuca]